MGGLNPEDRPIATAPRPGLPASPDDGPAAPAPGGNLVFPEGGGPTARIGPRQNSEATGPGAPWHGEAQLRFRRDDRGITRHQGGATAPLKIQRAFEAADGRRQPPLPPTAGGLGGVGRPRLPAPREAGSPALPPTVAGP